MMMKEYSLSAELRTGYLDIKVQGLRSFESAAAMAEEVFALIRKHQVSRLLLDIRDFYGKLGVPGSFRLCSGKVSKFKQLKIDRAAVIDSAPEEKSGWFIETAVRNWGYSLRIFSDVQEGKDWLLEDLT